MITRIDDLGNMAILDCRYQFSLQQDNLLFKAHMPSGFIHDETVYLLDTVDGIVYWFTYQKLLLVPSGVKSVKIRLMPMWQFFACPQPQDWNPDKCKYTE